jgi:hypothetical protein
MLKIMFLGTTAFLQDHQLYKHHIVALRISSMTGGLQNKSEIMTQ